ncbi:MAG: tRNA uracil 4-sulfurtransferase ThiI, partial [Candidatus Aenigmatarchaeota archaeon]
MRKKPAKKHGLKKTGSARASVGTKRFILKYGELWLKSEFVRNRFIKTLAENVSRQLRMAGIKDFRLERTRDMLILDCANPKAPHVLSKIFGITWFALAFETKPEMKAMEKAVLTLAKKIGKEQTFAIRASRSDKSLAFTSKDVENEMGKNVDRKVDLSNPDVTIFVELRKGMAYVYSEKVKGAGGLPYGVTGRVLSLVSGGIDSPVASWLMMKRGCSVDFIHYYVNESGVAKIQGLVKKLGEYAPAKLMLYSIPFASIQEAIVKNCDTHFTCVLCKRLMYVVAEALAKEARAKALVTGENLAQVASQTLDNLIANDSSVALPKFRPLLTMDKQETMALANKIGTYDLSIREAHACRFVP